MIFIDVARSDGGAILEISDFRICFFAGLAAVCIGGSTQKSLKVSKGSCAVFEPARSVTRGLFFQVKVTRHYK